MPAGPQRCTGNAKRPIIRQFSLLIRYIRENRRSYLLGAGFLLLTNFFALLIPWLMKLAVESLEHPRPGASTPGFYAGLIIAAAVGQGSIRIFSRTTLLHAARKIEYGIREELYNRILELDLSFFSRERTGDLMSRFTNDLTNVRMLTGFGVLNIINTVIIYVAALVLMARISPLLTVCAVLPFPLMIYIVKRLSASMFRRSLRAQEELARLSSLVEENVSAATVVKAYCREEYQLAAFSDGSSRYFQSNLAMAKLRGLMIPVMSTTGALGSLIVIFIGGRMVIAGSMTLGDFVAFTGYLAMLVWPTIMMGWILNLMQRGAASMERLHYILLAQAGVSEPASPVETPPIRGEIEFRGVRFAYDPGLEKSNDTAILKGIDLRIRAGMKVGFVGPVGSGKSTLMKLIPRLYPLTQGELLIDGVPVEQLPLRTLRRAVGFVPQESFLFSRTVAANIAYGKGGASREEIDSAVRLARLDGDVARFPAGLETLVGERGLTLSGGQKQRAAIARALLTNPSILILDDPLSAVDARTEEEILTGLGTFFGDRTVLVISHRLSALRHCELIVVLDEGRIVEQGSHEELVARQGRYASLYQEQQLRSEIEMF